MSDTPVLPTSVFAKTPVGQQEIQSRSLGLLPLVRRVLLLVDGKRSCAELATLVPEGNEVEPMIENLLALGCVEVLADSVAPRIKLGEAAPAESFFSSSSASAAALPGLPSSRTAKENEMARQFMMNSVNAIIGQGTRISLIHDIFHSETTQALREVYFAWEASMSNHGTGAKRLPELREKLFKVL